MFNQRPRAPWPVATSTSRMTKMASMASRPFQVSALAVQPQFHCSIGCGSARRSLSYVSSSVDTSPARTWRLSESELPVSTTECCTLEEFDSSMYTHTEYESKMATSNSGCYSGCYGRRQQLSNQIPSCLTHCFWAQAEEWYYIGVHEPAHPPR